MRPTIPSRRDLARWARELQALDRGADEARAWLATPQGRRFRVVVAQALIVSTPVILRHPIFKTPAGRLLEVAGGAALLVKVAELLRDWEPDIAAPPHAS